ncbi:unnamed protein product [Tilletia laevis]|nr:hypothetical protein CF335_g4613 [Tilletia laevis]KAE8256568.1 hypothetical protein A4X03_0g5278 [Tilletia caries]CAD6914702.1 unnamed protein product [Tilletia laevis]CAD6917716.1 unnamed protein product [Tilletia controversa]
MARADEDTLLFAGETWHCPAGLEAWGGDLYATTREARVRGVVVQGHRNGGLALWAGARVRGLISHTETSPYSISVTVQGRVIHAVYMPPTTLPNDPSMAHSYKTYLRPTSTGAVPDIILGDVNIRYGRSFGDASSGPQDRLDVMNDFVHEHGLTHHHPAPHSPYRVWLDHLYTRPGVSAVLIAHKTAKHIRTNHPIMDVKATWQIASATAPPVADTVSDADAGPEPPPATMSIDLSNDPLLQPIRRLQIKHLDDPKRKRALLWHWYRAYPKVLKTLKKARTRLDPGSAQGTVNKADRLIGRMLWDVTSKAFGTYSATEVKSQPDYLAQGLEGKPTAASAMRQFRRSQRGSQAIIVSRSPATLTVTEDVMQFYQALYIPDTSADYNMPFRPPPPMEKDVDDLLTGFDADAVQRAIKEYPAARSAGPDAIHPVLIKALSEEGLGQLLAHLFELCIRTGLTPTRWNTSVVHPIPKGAAETVPEAATAGVRQPEFHQIDKMRPISLTVLFRRLFEKCFLATFTETEKTFHPAQAGFRAGYSTVSHALVAHTDAMRDPGTQVFIDLKQAYDRTAMSQLFLKLRARGLSPGKMSLLYSLCIGTRSFVNVNGTLSPAAFERVRGIFQGSLLAPYLFNVYIDDLPSDVLVPTGNVSEDATQSLLYADDLKLRTTTRVTMVAILAKLDQWCLTNRMEVNISKSAELVAEGEEDVEQALLPLQINGNTLPRVASYTYLGFPHLSGGVDFLERCKKNFKKATGMVRYLDIIGKHWTPAVRLAIYKTLARPLLDYGGALLWYLCFDVSTPEDRTRCHESRLVRVEQTKARHEWTEEFDDHHKEAMLWIGNRGGKLNPIRVLGSIFGLNHPEDRMYKLAVMLQKHMLSLDPSSVASLRMTELEHAPVEDTSWEDALLARTRSDKVLQKLPDERETRRTLDLTPNTKVQQTLQLRAYLMLALHKPTSKLLEKIRPEARLPIPASRPNMTEPRPDSCIFIDNRETRTRAIDWRINRFCARIPCSGCGETLQRRCIDKCAEEYGCYPKVSESDQRMLDRGIAKYRAWWSTERKDPDDPGDGKKKKKKRKKYYRGLSKRNYLRPDAYLNEKRYAEFRTLMVYVDRLNRKTGTADEIIKPKKADKTSARARKEKEISRRVPQAMDTSLAPDWADLDAYTAIGAMGGAEGPVAAVNEGIDRRTPEPRQINDPKNVGGWWLPHPVETYATLDPSCFRPTVREEQRAEYEKLGLAIPCRSARAALIKELNIRAVGQGHTRHSPEEGKGYDPAKPYTKMTHAQSQRKMWERIQKGNDKAMDEYHARQARRGQSEEGRGGIHLPSSSEDSSPVPGGSKRKRVDSTRGEESPAPSRRRIASPQQDDGSGILFSATPPPAARKRKRRTITQDSDDDGQPSSPIAPWVLAELAKQHRTAATLFSAAPSSAVPDPPRRPKKQLPPWLGGEEYARDDARYTLSASGSSSARQSAAVQVPEEAARALLERQRAAKQDATGGTLFSSGSIMSAPASTGAEATTSASALPRQHRPARQDATGGILFATASSSAQTMSERQRGKQRDVVPLPPKRDNVVRARGEEHELDHDIGKYATLHPRSFKANVDPKDQAEYLRLGLTIPPRGARKILLDMLQLRAAGQGLGDHEPHLGKGYDPAQPFKKMTPQERWALWGAIKRDGPEAVAAAIKASIPARGSTSLKNKTPPQASC